MRTILAAGGLSLLLTLLVTPQFIKFLTRRQYGQFIRDDGPKEHLTKRGTPTMGGVVIVASVVLSYFIAHLILWESVTVSGVLLLGVMTALGFLGFLDDWAKISKERSLGLTPRGKLIGQFTIGGVFAVLALNFPDERGLRPASEFVSFLRDLPWLHLPFFLAVIWIVFLLMAWPNATNLTDGLDGLLAGSATLVFAAFSLVNIWQFNQWCGRVSSVGPLLRGARPLRPGGGLNGTRRLLLRFPVVERQTRSDLHGRYRLHGHRCGSRGIVDHDPHGTAAGNHGFPVRHGGRFRGAPSRVFQGYEG